MIYLTGIKPTGKIHFGNYLSVIEPLIKINKTQKNSFYCFIADYHSLTTHPKPKELKENIYDLACTLYAIDNNIIFYRQSKIPEIFELNWILSCFTAKGYLNRGHAYRTKLEENLNKEKDPDKGIFAGIYNYPVLMSADILAIQPDYVPLGKDQKQHLEITKDIAQKINHIYKKQLLKIPQDIYCLNDIEIKGKDGRKMSKSYNNTMPLIGSEKKLKKYCFSLATNSKKEGEKKYKDECEIINLIEFFGTKEEILEIYNLLNIGASWGYIKQIGFEIINNKIKYIRNSYNFIINNKNGELNHLLEQNEKLIREKVKNTLNFIKESMGFL